MSETKIGKYTILGEIGRGAMGIVYKATDPYIGRTVAIKTIRFDVLGQGPEREMAQKRFMREAHSAGNLSHPNIVTIYEVGEDEGLSYIAMEFIDGTSLEDLISGKKRLSLDEVIVLVEKVADALDAAHRKGVVHRDIKPANILLDTESRPHLVDFGIARISTSTMTQTNMIMGTPYYMSPEQIAGKKVDNRSDIFALGGVLYELLTGQKPFPGESITTVIYKIMNETPLPMRTFQKNLPEGLEAIVQKTLAKDPEARYQNCRDLVNDLKNYSTLGLAETLIHEMPPNVGASVAPAEARRARRGIRPPLLIAGGAAVICAVVAAVLIFGGKSSSQAGNDASLPSPPPPVETVAFPASRNLFLSGQALMKEKQWDRALEAFARVPTAAPEYYEARFLSAESLFQAGRNAEAEQALLDLTNLRRDDSRVYLRLGQLYDRQNEGAKAVQFYQTYLSFTPKGPDAEQALKRLTNLQAAQPQAKDVKRDESRKVQPDTSETVSTKPAVAEPQKTGPKDKSQAETASGKPAAKAEEKAEPPGKKETVPPSKPEPKKPSALTAVQKAEVKRLTQDGAEAINRKDYDQAVAKLEQALAIEATNQEAKSHLAIAKQKQAERDRPAKLRKAKEALWYRRYDEALREARDILAFSPADAEARKVAAQALQGVRKEGADVIESLTKDYTQSVSKGEMTGFYQRNGTSSLYQKIRRDMELIIGQYGSLRISVSGGSARITDFQAEESRGVINKMTGEVTFSQTLTGVPKSGGGRQTLFEGSIRWKLEFLNETWKIVEVVSTPKAK